MDFSNAKLQPAASRGPVGPVVPAAAKRPNAFLQSIVAGKALKKAAHVEKPPKELDARDGLLNSIKMGAKLKKVEHVKKEDKKPEGLMGNIMDLLSRRAAIEDSDDDDDDDDEDWDD